MVKLNKEFERIMELSNKILDEMEHRSKVDKEVDKLLQNGQYEKVKQLLDSLDNNVIKKLQAERDNLLYYINVSKDEELEQETETILGKIGNLTFITSNYLYEQLQNPINKNIASHIDFVDQIMNMCSDYATQLIPETDTTYSVSMNRIRAALTLLSDYLTIYLLTEELQKQVTSIINICFDYLKQIEVLSYDNRGEEE